MNIKPIYLIEPTDPIRIGILKYVILYRYRLARCRLSSFGILFCRWCKGRNGCAAAATTRNEFYHSKPLRQTEKINNNQNCFAAIRFVRRAHTHNNSTYNVLSYIILVCIYARRTVAAVQCGAIGVSAIDIYLHIYNVVQIFLCEIIIVVVLTS